MIVLCVGGKCDGQRVDIGDMAGLPLDLPVRKTLDAEDGPRTMYRRHYIFADDLKTHLVVYVPVQRDGAPQPDSVTLEKLVAGYKP